MTEQRPLVLVVDDDPELARAVAEVLAEDGFRTVDVTDPEEAVRRAGAKHFAVAVVDFVMPGMNGLEVADRIRVADPDTQVVMLTAHATVEVAIEAINHAVFGLISKPGLDRGLLVRSVERASQRARTLRHRRELLAFLAESSRLGRSVLESGTSLFEAKHLDRLLAQLVASAKRLSQAVAGRAMLLRSEARDSLLVEVAAGDGASDLAGTRLPVSEGIAALAASGAETIIVAEPGIHPSFSKRWDELPGRVSGLLCAPLRYGGIRGVLLLGAGRETPFADSIREPIAALAQQAAVAIDHARQHEQAANFFAHTSELLVSMLDRLDELEAGHSRQVAHLADMLSRRLGLPEAERRDIHFGALLHDIGKMQLDLTKRKEPGNEAWRQERRRHPELGFAMVEPIALFSGVLPILRHHHERWDGTGYPAGLEGDEIPLGARVVAVANVFDALTRRAPDRPARSPEEALGELERRAGSQLEPRLARLFVAEYRRQFQAPEGGH
jgi:putative nucleotidyltransferase with HDIG domain